MKHTAEEIFGFEFEPSKEELELLIYNEESDEEIDNQFEELFKDLIDEED